MSICYSLDKATHCLFISQCSISIYRLFVFRCSKATHYLFVTMFSKATYWLSAFRCCEASCTWIHRAISLSVYLQKLAKCTYSIQLLILKISANRFHKKILRRLQNIFNIDFVLRLSSKFNGRIFSQYHEKIYR